MKIFLSLNVANPDQLLAFEELVSSLKSIGVSVVSAIDLKRGSLDNSQFESLDALIIDGSGEGSETGYLLAIGLAHKKPVLYLLPKGSVIDPSVEALTFNKEVKKYIKISFYSKESLHAKVRAFLQYLDENLGKEAYTIKYTLRLSPRIDRYVTWKSERVKKNKADFIRDAMSDQMNADEEYKNRLKAP